MTKKIAKEIIASTKCDKGFECLTSHETLCEVIYCVDNKVHFLRCDNRVCKYKIFFGNDYFCSCPVRKELYNTYRI